MPDDTALFADLARLAGLSRPAGQCFGLIWRVASPPCADQLCAASGLSRSNVSTAMKELRLHGLIATVRAPGDRKDYFTAPADPFEVLRLILAARLRQDLAPLRDRAAAAAGGDGPAVADGRMAALAAALDRIVMAGEALGVMPAASLERMLAEPAAAPDGPPRKKKKKRKG